MLESGLQRKVRQNALNRFGIKSIKLKSDGTNGYPDVEFFIPGGRSLYVEFKRPGQELRPLQKKRVQDLLDLGYNVKVCDNEDEAYREISNALEAARLSKEGSKIFTRARRSRAVS